MLSCDNTAHKKETVIGTVNQELSLCTRKFFSSCTFRLPTTVFLGTWQGADIKVHTPQELPPFQHSTNGGMKSLYFSCMGTAESLSHQPVPKAVTDRNEPGLLTKGTRKFF